MAKAKKSALATPPAPATVRVPIYYQPAFFGGFASVAPPVGQQKMLRPKVQLWTQHPATVDYQLGRAVLVDPALTPSRSWPQFDIDDHTNDPEEFGYTTIGPMFPHAYGAASVYLSGDAMTRLNANWFAPHDFSAQVSLLGGQRVRHHGYYGINVGGAAQRSLWVIYAPGCSDKAAVRAPRKAFLDSTSVSRDPPVQPAHILPPPAQLPNTEAIYVERYAAFGAYLVVPKRPSGSGEVIVALAAAAGGIPVPGGRLNVISDEPSQELTAIRASLQGNYLVVGQGQTPADAIIAYFNANPRNKFTSLDLIGHSRSGDSLLKIGQFVLTPVALERQCQIMQGALLSSQVQSIRLLGCRTGCHPNGRAAVAVIKEYYPSLAVYAARHDLFAVHYSGSGLRPEAEALLASSEVFAAGGPGDGAATDDYVLVPDDSPDRPIPEKFSLSTLSLANASPVSAMTNYIYWDGFQTGFGDLQEALYGASPVPDNPLVRPDFEVLVSITPTPQSIDDFRSFDLFTTTGPARARVHAGDRAFSFLLRSSATKMVTSLLGLRSSRRG